MRRPSSHALDLVLFYLFSALESSWKADQQHVMDCFRKGWEGDTEAGLPILGQARGFVGMWEYFLRLRTNGTKQQHYHFCHFTHRCSATHFSETLWNQYRISETPHQSTNMPGPARSSDVEESDLAARKSALERLEDFVQTGKKTVDRDERALQERKKASSGEEKELQMRKKALEWNSKCLEEVKRDLEKDQKAAMQRKRQVYRYSPVLHCQRLLTLACRN